MKKIILIPLLVGMLAMTGVTSDRAGRDNTTTGDDMLTQLYDEVFPTTNQPQKSLDTTTALNLLNSAALEASVDLYCVERDTVILMIAGTEWYNLPSDFYDVPLGNPVHGVVAVAGGTGDEEVGMKPMSLSQIGKQRPTSSSNEIPSQFLIRKFRIHVEPVNNSNDTVRVYYAAYASVLDSVQDTTNIDKPYIHYVVLKAAEKFLEGANWGTAQAYATKRLAEVQKSLLLEEKRWGIIRQSVIEDMVK